MKRMIRFFILLCFAAVLFCGCSTASVDSATAAVLEENRLTDEGAGNAESTLLPDQKLIKTIHMDIEAVSMDELLSALTQQLSALGGYVENRSIYNDNFLSMTQRSAKLTMRVPAEQISSFVSNIEGTAQVLSITENTEDITLTYVATESRLKALQAEEARLLELMEKAANLNEVLQIETRLTNVRNELESITSQLKVMGNRVQYATLYLSIVEVEKLSATNNDLWSQISRGFTQSLRSLGNLLLGTLVFLAVCSPYLVFFGLIILVIVLLRRRYRKKHPLTKHSHRHPDNFPAQQSILKADAQAQEKPNTSDNT